MSQSGIPVVSDIAASPVGDVISVAATPITAPINAVGAAVSGENLATSALSATSLGQTGLAYGGALNSAGVSAGGIPIIGGDIQAVQNYASNPYDTSNALNYGITAGKFGGAAILGGGSFKDSVSGYGTAAALSRGDLSVLNQFLPDELSGLGGLFGGGNQATGLNRSPASITPTNFVTPGTQTAVYNQGDSSSFLIIGIVALAAYLYFRRK